MGYFHPEQPVQFSAFSGGQAMDILWTSFTPLMVISEYIYKLFEENGIIGWSTFLVEVLDRRQEKLPGYFGLAITGRAGPVDRTRGELVSKPPLVPGGAPTHMHKGLYFDETQWDGSDIFVLGHGGYIIVREKVKQLFGRAKVRNVLLTALPDVELNVTPGRAIHPNFVDTESEKK